MTPLSREQADALTRAIFTDIIGKAVRQAIRERIETPLFHELTGITPADIGLGDE